MTKNKKLFIVSFFRMIECVYVQFDKKLAWDVLISKKGLEQKQKMYIKFKFYRKHFPFLFCFLRGCFESKMSFLSKVENIRVTD